MQGTGWNTEDTGSSCKWPFAVLVAPGRDIWCCRPLHHHWAQPLVVSWPMLSGTHCDLWEAWGHQDVSQWTWWMLRDLHIRCKNNVGGQTRQAASLGVFCRFLQQEAGRLLWLYIHLPCWHSAMIALFCHKPFRNKVHSYNLSIGFPLLKKVDGEDMKIRVLITYDRDLSVAITDPKPTRRQTSAEEAATFMSENISHCFEKIA